MIIWLISNLMMY